MPKERSASPKIVAAGYVVAAGLAILLFLYVGSFAFIVLLGWTVLPPLDARTEAALQVLYWPLVWIVQTALTFSGYTP